MKINDYLLCIDKIHRFADYITINISSPNTPGLRDLQLRGRIENLVKKKEKAQPTRIKTSGSTFKNPKSQTNKKVWELIKESVPLDKSFGDACISEKHCNFFVNKGSASFNDINNLIEFVSKEFLEKTGIKLEKEIKILK